MADSRSFRTCDVVVVGGGFAGAWVACRLAQRGVTVILISADDVLPPVSRALSIGLMRRQFVEDATARRAEFFTDSSASLPPAVPPLIAEYLGREFDALTELVRYREFLQYLMPVVPERGLRVGLGDEVVAAVLAEFQRCGGIRLRGRVTDLVMEGDACRGLHYEQGGVHGQLFGADVVLASGGFCGLFADGVGSNSGHVLGTYARHGGALANLEMFARFPLGDLDRKVPVYPFELEGAPHLMRADATAHELIELLEVYDGDLVDLEVFRRYWIRNFDVPHTIASPRGRSRLGPIKGFSMGGMAISMTGETVRNVHAVGECAYDLAVDSVSGKPFATYLALGGMLADQLADRRHSSVVEPGSGVSRANASADAQLRALVEQGLSSFQDNRFSFERAERFVDWCRTERRVRQREDCTGNEDVDLLILAEAYACSVLARTESRGFFYRPDFPAPDPALAGAVTVARYDASADQVLASLVHHVNQG
ncbi:FAD-dependent oxidoreductase [Lentzea alba]|uniref:FAD-dependent oxidoreductase n=1 Tax=Lentzea alba TaxID=2714351 RepID=UPI0039BFE097